MRPAVFLLSFVRIVLFPRNDPRLANIDHIFEMIIVFIIRLERIEARNEFFEAVAISQIKSLSYFSFLLSLFGLVCALPMSWKSYCYWQVFDFLSRYRAIDPIQTESQIAGESVNFLLLRKVIIRSVSILHALKLCGELRFDSSLLCHAEYCTQHFFITIFARPYVS